MSHSESAIAGFYDHEQEQDPSRSRRERQAPDWGGDDLFSSTPRRRRFDRPGHADSFGARRRETSEHPLPAARRFAPSTPATRGDRHDAPSRLDLGTLTDVLAPVVDEPAPQVDEPEVSGHVATLRPVEPTEPPAPARTEEPPTVGRRTVLVTGHPDRMPVRRRPAPTIDERLIGSRPERIAAYAFGMGLLLILIAILTANA
jgi:hypothetical protein